jgi:hypothetical protein
MNSCFRALLTCSLLLLCGSIAFGQESSGTMTSTISVRDGMERIPRVVTGLPYSAVTESESSQTGADGTRFDRKMEKDKTYRDSQGRTRLEHYLATGLSSADPPTLVTVMIHDPVAQTAYSLNPRDHTAREMPFHVPRTDDTDRNTFVTARLQPRTADGNERPTPKITVEDLGTQVIDGLTAEGKRTTMTFPASAQGNDKPFDTVTERWFSQELKIYVLIKNSDPRSGDHTIKTTIIDRAEPDPSLFQVPPDYTITQR